ncbi:MAG: lysophospholipid acyltransferase family protein [Planctomycetota bacterium]|jgi:1-acyl-sn-glycerol-3-phosphate acyltransferase
MASMVTGLWISLAILAWVGFALLANWIESLSVRGTLDSGAVMVGIRLYSRLVHGLTIQGRENIPSRRDRRAMIVVCNHTAGIDPLLVQAVFPYEITWTMAQDMRLAWAERFWEWSGILFVDRRGGGSSGARKALRVLAEGGVLGIFPEGRLERPHGRLLRFHAGVGLLTIRSGAHVVPVVIDGTPEVESAWGSLWRMSRSRVRVLKPIVYDAGTRPGEVVSDLQRRFVEATGWPVAADKEAG